MLCLGSIGIFWAAMINANAFPETILTPFNNLNRVYETESDTRQGRSPSSISNHVDQITNLIWRTVMSLGQNLEGYLLQISLHCFDIKLGCMQVGLNGVDNGSLRFSGVRIPRENLLDRFGQVDSDGKYSSSLSQNKRFAATLGELTGGRVGLTCASTGILKVMAS